MLVHGIYAGSSSFEFRELFPLLAQRHRVVAIDLLGCGLSERPRGKYSADLFVQQIVDAIDTFGTGASAVVGSSLGGAFAVRAAARQSERVKALALICPTGLCGTLDRKPSRLQVGITKTIMTPGIGQALFNLLASRPSLKWFLENQAYADPHSATADIVEYYWTATHQPGSRYVPAHFVGGALNCDISNDLPRVSAPILIAWGERADGPSPISGAPEYVNLARAAELATFSRSRLLPQEEEPDLLASRLERFFASVPA